MAGCGERVQIILVFYAVARKELVIAFRMSPLVSQYASPAWAGQIQQDRFMPCYGPERLGLLGMSCESLALSFRRAHDVLVALDARLRFLLQPTALRAPRLHGVGSSRWRPTRLAPEWSLAPRGGPAPIFLAVVGLPLCGFAHWGRPWRRHAPSF